MALYAGIMFSNLGIFGFSVGVTVGSSVGVSLGSGVTVGVAVGSGIGVSLGSGVTVGVGVGFSMIVVVSNKSCSFVALISPPSLDVNL